MSPALRFCANLKWLFTEVPFPQRFAAAAQAGFSAVEYASPYAFPAAEQRRWLADNDLHLTLINTPTGPAGTVSASGQACHPQSMAAFRQDITLAIEYAVALAVPMIHLQAGILPPQVTPQQALETLCENLQLASQLATREGITLVLEAINPHDIPDYFLTTQAAALNVIQQADTLSVKLLFDIYHCQRAEGDVTARLRQFMPHIQHIQVADAPMRHQPGEGELHWPFLFAELQRLNYRGWIGCEYRPSGTTLSSLEWMTAYR